MKKYLILYSLIILALAGCKRPPTEAEKEGQSSKLPLEYKLAIINKKGYVSKEDVTITRFRYLLQSLESKTINNKQEIANMSVAAVNRIRDEYGCEVKLLELMEYANKVVAEGSNVNYIHVMVAYIQLYK